MFFIAMIYDLKREKLSIDMKLNAAVNRSERNFSIVSDKFAALIHLDNYIYFLIVTQLYCILTL